MSTLIHTTWACLAYAGPFYLFCGLPAQYVRRHVAASMGSVGCLSLTAATALVGGVPAYLTAVALLGRSPAAARFTPATIADGIGVMAIVTAISVWRRRAAERALVVARARAHALQAQINPHFFFNTLNTIAALIPGDPSAAQDTVARLAEMSRYAFSSAELKTAPLARELQFARAYLDIERTRFGNRLRFELPDEASVDGLSLPPLTVQPLIENAVRHGIAKRPDGGMVSVRVQRSAVGFVLVVENDTEEGETIAETAFFQSTHALTNIRDRLRLLDDRMASIDVSIPRPALVTVTIRARTLPA